MDDPQRRHSRSVRGSTAVLSLVHACLVWTCCSEADISYSAANPASRADGMFVDVAVDVGLTREHVGGGPDKGYIVEAKGGGAALLDFDDDGDLDIYWVNGATLAAPDRGAGNALYRNDEGVFVDVAESHGVQGRGWGMGAISADYDNDGDADLYVTNLQANILYRSDGSGQAFTDIAPAAGVATPGWSTGAAFADYDRDGDVDLYVASYVILDTTDVASLGSQWKGVPAFVGPLGLRAASDVLYRNEGDGRFLDVTAEAAVSQREPGYGFAVLFADYDGDGDPDLYVANDSSPNFMFRNEGSGRFSDQSLRGNAAFGESGISQAGMGASWGDYDGDGLADIFVTNFEDDYNTLYHNDGSGQFSDVSFDVGLARPSLNYVGFGTSFADFDNDADLDLFVANGHVYPAIGSGGTGATYAELDHLFENVNGRFALHPSAGEAFSTARVSRGSCVGDFDNDGDLDIFVSNLNDRPVLLRNESSTRNNWVGLLLRGTVSNRDAIGAHVQLFAGGRRQVRDILCGSSFLSSEDRRVHFGLGETAAIDSIDVLWPSGAVQRLTDVQVNRYTLIEEEDHSSRIDSM